MTSKKCWACGTWPCYPDYLRYLGSQISDVTSSWVCYKCGPVVGRWASGVARGYLIRALETKEKGRPG